jgi:hypothetical protein
MIVAVEERRAKFAELMDQGVSVQTAGARVGISPAVAHRWAAMYRSGGLERLAPVGTTRVRYPFLVKYMAVRACLEGAGESAVLEAFVLRSAGTLLRWRQAFRKARSRGAWRDGRRSCGGGPASPSTHSRPERPPSAQRGNPASLRRSCSKRAWLRIRVENRGHPVLDRVGVVPEAPSRPFPNVGWRGITSLLFTRS